MNAANPQNKTVTLLFNPFFYIAGVQALVLGLIAIGLTALIAYFGNAHFDGVLDTHIGAAAPLWLFFLEGLIDWLCLSIVLWICGRIISRTMFRTIDVLGTQALARWPSIFISLLALPEAFSRFTHEFVAQIQRGDFHINPVHVAVFLLLAMAMLPFVCWTIRLMYKSFSVACNVSGGKAIGTFIVGLLIAEIVSKLAITHVAVIAIAQQATPPTSVTAGANDKDLQKAASVFVQLLQDGKFSEATAQFSPKMKSAMDENQLRGAWTELTSKIGQCKKQLGTNLGNYQGFKLVLVTCQFERAPQGIRVVYDGDNLVTGLWFVEPDPALVSKHKD